MIAPARQETAQAYLAYLKAAEENPTLRVELINGEIVMSPAPLLIHQIVLNNLSWLLNEYVRRNRLGQVLSAPVDVELAAEESIVQPDLIFIQAERMEALADRLGIMGSPDLAVEILSPGTAHVDRRVKLPLYARYGIAEYWLVDADDEAVEVYTLAGDTYRVAGIFRAGDTINAGQFAAAQISMDDVFEK